MSTAIWKGLTASAIKELAESITAETAALRAQLAGPDAPPPREALRLIVDGPWTKANPANARAKFCDMVHPSAEVRDAATEARAAIAAAKRSVFSDEALHAAVSPWLSEMARAHPAATPGQDGVKGSVSAPDGDALDAVFARGVLAKFEQVGLLSATAASTAANASTGRDRGLEVLKELSDAENAWKAALQASVAETRLEFDDADLEGVPETTLRTMDRVDGSETRRVVRITYPHVSAVLGFCERRETRRDVYRAFRARGGAGNEELMVRLATLRREFAELRGFASFADLVQAGNRMAGSARRVTAFLSELEETTRAAGAKERAELEAFARAELGLGSLEPWDATFATNRFKAATQALDMREVNKHFPASHVVPEVMKIYEELLGVSFERVDTDDVWHPDVQVFRAVEASGGGKGTFLGLLYLDLWPREGKYGHACVCNLIDTPSSAAEVSPEDSCAMICNLGKEMTHGDAVTFLHEFGHVVHDVLMRQGGKSAFAKVPRDFVEAPSQMLENWGYNDVILARLTRHIDTGKPMPSEMADKLRTARHTMGITALRRQLQFSTFDMFLHDTAPPKTAAEVVAKEVQLSKDLCGWSVDPSYSAMARNFGHTASQYSASYYGYLWSEVFSADMFETVFSDSAALTDPEKGAHYRRSILYPGGTLSGDVMLHNFLGRAPTMDAFRRDRGLDKI